MPIRPRIQPLVGSKRTTTAHATEPGKTVAVRGAVGTASKIRTPVKVQAFRALLRNAPLAERVAIERDGVPFQVVQGLIAGIGVSSVDFQRYVRMPKATFSKKMKEKALFSGTSGQSVVGLLELINKVEDMLLAEQGDALAGFDVEKWVGQWIQRPQPALGGMAPADLLDTPSGRESVMRVLGAIQSGAYQ